MTQDEMTAALREQAETLERLAKEPLKTAIVAGVEGDDMLVISGGQSWIIAQNAAEPLVVGDQILLHAQTNQFVRRSPVTVYGGVYDITELDDTSLTAIVEVNGQQRRVSLANEASDARVGDRLLVDDAVAVGLRVVPINTTEFSVPPTGVAWDDIGGQSAAKQTLREAIEFPTLHADVFTFYNAKGSRGVLLSGPPGCGKTMLGKAAATSIGAIDGFIYCKGPEVLDPFVGVAETRVRSLFDRARAYHGETGRRAIIFIDEAEALLGHRGGRMSHMEKTIVPTFLAEMDGVEDSGAIVILATNHPLSLDPAIVRDGRIDRKVEVSRPGRPDSVEIVIRHLRGVPVIAGLSAYEVAEDLVDAIFSKIVTVNGRRVGMGDMVSGALLAGVVEKAKFAAMRRDIEKGSRTGVSMEDIEAAVEMAADEMSSTSMQEA